MPPTALADRLTQLAGKDPDRPAVTCGSDTMTRLQFDRYTNALARAYAEHGVNAGDLVTIGLPNSIEFVCAAVATWKLGATPQPVSHRLPPAELTAVVEVAKPALVIGLDIPGLPAIAPGYCPEQAHEPLPPAIGPCWKAPASGGSTGRPKVIMSTQPACAEVMDEYALAFAMPQDGVHLVAGPLSHNGPFMMSAAALFTGSHVVIMPRFEPAGLLRLVEAYRVQWTFLVPTMMHRIWRLPEEVRAAADMSSLRIVLHGAAPCAPWLKLAWLDWLGPHKVFELYAATEAQAACLISGPEWLDHPGSVGRVARGEIRVLDSDHRDVPPGELGEIWMRHAPGSPETYRYLGAEATIMDDGWESTGDMGRVDADGYVYLTDRKPDMILVGGANVFPAEIENALDEHPSVLASCVIGLPDDEYGNIVHAVVQTNGPLDEPALLAHLQSRLSAYKLPRSFERVDYPLRDDAGKVRRAQVREQRLTR
ncbi:bile acid-coenzyme A ligase [Kibdelosporangium banguiense]|uniref:Bile acid-coenzyme A ligase n=1 Tax=Kibdelosporangium banguiense TaxID=1365924 RepID=A0ABS4TQ72_9PSEU|nr:AMP-binding protein [Kibdelosporangium banguiense]MBP2326090.1 bile acid-coenzyme A ligase [Kibdelosporangium banguiense]